MNRQIAGLQFVRWSLRYKRDAVKIMAIRFYRFWAIKLKYRVLEAINLRLHIARLLRIKLDNYGEFEIYLLKAPGARQGFYIGRSKNPDRRLQQHVKESLSKKSPTEKQEIIRRIVSSGKSLRMKMLDKWIAREEEWANELEASWVAEYTVRGHNLTNRTGYNLEDPDWYIGAARRTLFFIAKCAIIIVFILALLAVVL